MNSTASGLVYIVEDSQEVGYWLKRSLERAGFEVVLAASAEDFWGLSDLRTPSMLLLDMHLPQATGLDVQARLKARDLFMPVVFISGQSRNDEIIQAFRDGAIEFLWKPFTQEELLAAVHKALALSRERAEQDARARQAQDCLERLSSREREILPLILKGYSNKQIAQLVDIQPDTAKKHRLNILEKCDSRDLPELIVLFAHSEAAGIPDPTDS